jgi:membrane-associated PAP2 superfamily phosphatase
VATFWDEINRLVYRAERDQLHLRAHPGDLATLERCCQAMVRRILAGIGALMLAGIGCAVYMRTGHLICLASCSVLSATILTISVVLPLRKKVVLRDESRN